MKYDPIQLAEVVADMIEGVAVKTGEDLEWEITPLDLGEVLIETPAGQKFRLVVVEDKD